MVQVISFLHQEEIYDDISEEEISLIKIGNEADDQIHRLNEYALISVSLNHKHYGNTDQLNSRLFNDIITPPPDR